EAPRDVLVRRMERGREVRRAVPAGRVLCAEGGVAADLLAGRLCVPEEMAGRVDADHHRAVDPLRVAPGVDHRRARPGALAEQVDALVAERAAGGLEVVDAFGERVSGEVDAVVLKTMCAGPERGSVGAIRLLAQEVARVLARRCHFRTVELRRAVDPAVADE